MYAFVNIKDGKVQLTVDVLVLFLFVMQVLLYLDEKILEWSKQPIHEWYSKILSVEFFYDLACVGASLFAIFSYQNSVTQRYVALFFMFKIYKLVQIDIKCTTIVAGTRF